MLGSIEPAGRMIHVWQGGQPWSYRRTRNGLTGFCRTQAARPPDIASGHTVPTICDRTPRQSARRGMMARQVEASSC